MTGRIIIPPVPETDHHGYGEGSCSVHSGRPDPADGTEQAGTDDRDLGRSARTLPGNAAGEIREQLAGFCLLHEHAENDEHGNKGGGNPGDGTKNSCIGDQILHLDDFGQGHRPAVEHSRQVRGNEEIPDEPGNKPGHGRNYGTAHRLDKQENIQPAKNHLHGSDRVHELEAHGQHITLHDDIQLRQGCRQGKQPVDPWDTVSGGLFRSAKTQKGSRKEKKKMYSPLQSRLQDSEIGGVQLKQGERDQPESHSIPLPSG